jgi:hypothetical protein
VIPIDLIFKLENLHKIQHILDQPILSLAVKPLPELMKYLRNLRNMLAHSHNFEDFTNLENMFIPMFIKERYSIKFVKLFLIIIEMNH